MTTLQMSHIWNSCSIVWRLGKEWDDEDEGEEERKKYAEAKKRAATMSNSERLMMIFQVCPRFRVVEGLGPNSKRVSKRS